MNAPSPPTSFIVEDASRSTGSRALRRLLGTALGPLVGLAAVVLVFAVADEIVAYQTGRPRVFFTTATGQQVLRDASQVGVAALGMTLIIIAGGIDLSAGTAMALCATVIAWVFRDNQYLWIGYPGGWFSWMGLPASDLKLLALPVVPSALLAGTATGCAAGFLNGVLISGLRVVPFIVTLGTMTIFLGAGLILADDTPIRAFGKVPDWILALQEPYPPRDYEWLLVSSGVWVMLALAAGVAVLLHYTVFGRHVFALGSNESTARLCGINVTRTRIAVYTLAGFFVGVAGLFQFAILNGEGNPNDGPGKELEVIAAVVIGGGSLSGGRGSVAGTISGACIMAAILQGCVSLDIPTSYQKVIVGVIIVAAVALDQVRQRRLAA